MNDNDLRATIEKYAIMGAVCIVTAAVLAWLCLTVSMWFLATPPAALAVLLAVDRARQGWHR